MVEKSKELANLTRIGKLAVEPGAPGEIKGPLISGNKQVVLTDLTICHIGHTLGNVHGC